MGQGFLGGLVWGGLVGTGMLFVSSQAMERQELSLPQPQATAVEVPGGSEFDQARVETDPVLPEADARPDAGASALAAIPQDAVDAPPRFDTTALQVPTPAIGEAGGLRDAPRPGVAPDAPESADAARPGESGSDLVQPERPGAAPDAGAAAPQPQAPALDETGANRLPDPASEAPESSDLAALPQTGADSRPDAAVAAPAIGSESSSPEALTAPDAGAAPTQPETGSDVALPQVAQLSAPETGEAAPAITPAPETPTAPQAPEAGSSAAEAPVAELEETPAPSALQPVERFENKAEDVETDRLPRIGSETGLGTGTGPGTGKLPGVRRLGNESAEAAAEAAEENAPEAETAVPEDAPAIRRFGQAYEKPGEAPLLSLVLVQESDRALSREVIETLPETLAYAVDAGRGDGAALAASYRAAGREVVMIPALPEGARPQDVEQALRVNFDAVPEAVAIMDMSGASFQSDRAAVQQVVDVVADTGHGLITYPRGLNTAHQAATRAGVPAGLIFRRLDGSGESIEQIRRALDRAAFRARNDAAVILVGSTAPDTIVAILEWAAGNRAQSVAIVPISVALLGE